MANQLLRISIFAASIVWPSSSTLVINWKKKTNKERKPEDGRKEKEKESLALQWKT